MKHGNQANQSSPTEEHPNREAVARRAYELYQARGGEPGHELEDWLSAEQEVTRKGQPVPSEA